MNLPYDLNDKGYIIEKSTLELLWRLQGRADTLDKLHVLQEALNAARLEGAANQPNKTENGNQ